MRRLRRKAPAARPRMGGRAVRRRRLPAGVKRWTPVALAVGLATAAGAFLWQSDWPARAIAGAVELAVELTRAAGLQVNEIAVVGRMETPSATLLAAVGAERGDALLAIDPAEVKARLERLPWVARATVERRLPDQLFLAIEERRPAALLQRQDGYALIDRAGVIIEAPASERFRYLPVLAGEGAPAEAGRLIDLLAAEPEIGRRVTAGAWVAGRRWNLRLDNGVELRLPAENPAAALAELAAIERRHKLLESDLAVIDFRLPDRVVVRLTPEAAARRRAPGDDT